jgi:threonine dehydratase
MNDFNSNNQVNNHNNSESTQNINIKKNIQDIAIKYIPLILTSKVYDIAIETPLEQAKQLTAKLNNNVYFKREDLQPVFSFKIRGAYNKIAHLTQKEREAGIIAASAGNHAQGVAISAAKLGIKAFIVMPVTTPQLKISAVKRFGKQFVTVVLHGESYSDSYKHALELQQQHNLVFIHPFDDPYVIAGQGTVAMEIVKQFAQFSSTDDIPSTDKKIDAIFVGIGGGGLVSGVASYIKSIAPHIKIIGMQTVDSNAMQQSINANTNVVLNDVGLFSDGTAVKRVGDLTLEIAKQLIDEIITVDTDEICASIKEIFEDTRSIVEPAGALAVAGIKKYIQKYKCKNQNLISINCGANMNFDRLAFVAERAQIGEAKEAIFAISIPEERGSFKRFCDLLGQHHITEFNYRYASEDKEAHIFVGIQVQDIEDISLLEQSFKNANLKALNLTHDELAKLHIRHMVGGRADAENEKLLRFVFPERPGALMKFLLNMEPNWNISLFHYRNHGADYARVLVGMQVPPQDNDKLGKFLQDIEYPYTDETEHAAYKLFLKK